MKFDYFRKNNNNERAQLVPYMDICSSNMEIYQLEIRIIYVNLVVKYDMAN